MKVIVSLLSVLALTASHKVSLESKELMQALTASHKVSLEPKVFVLEPLSPFLTAHCVADYPVHYCSWRDPSGNEFATAPNLCNHSCRPTNCTMFGLLITRIGHVNCTAHFEDKTSATASLTIVLEKQSGDSREREATLANLSSLG